MESEGLQSFVNQLLLDVCHEFGAFMTTSQALVEEDERAQLFLARVQIAALYHFFYVRY